jgi:hypothetical protein
VTELVIAEHARAHLTPHWVEYWSEVPTETGRIDLVGRDAAGDLHAVEVKLGASLALAAQCCLRLSEGAFATVLGVVGVRERSRYRRTDCGDDLAHVAREVGFGVLRILVREEAPTLFTLLVPPRPRAVDPPGREAVSRALNDVHRGVAAPAGSPHSAYWTLWKQGVADLEHAVAKEPGITPEAAMRALHNSGIFYWRNEVQQVRKLAESSSRLRVVYVRGRLHYYPVAQEGAA